MHRVLELSLWPLRDPVVAAVTAAVAAVPVALMAVVPSGSGIHAALPAVAAITAGTTSQSLALRRCLQRRKYSTMPPAGSRPRLVVDESLRRHVEQEAQHADRSE